MKTLLSKFVKICKIFLEFMSLFMSRSCDQLSQYVPAQKSTKICFFFKNFKLGQILLSRAELELGTDATRIEMTP